MDADIALVVDDPAWLPHRYDPGYDTFHFRRVTRPDHASATFLIDEYLKDASGPLVIERGAVRRVTDARATAPLHMIFHSAFCCSTLLARALDVDGVATTLKEPVVLNDLVGWRRRGAAPARLADVVRDTLATLARPFGEGEAVVVKPANIVNVLAPSILAARGESAAIVMYTPIDTFLTSVAKKGLDGRLWVRGLFAGLMQDGIVDFGYDAQALFGQTDLQIAALGWLAQHRVFHALIAGPVGHRVRSLRSDVLLRSPAAVIERAGVLFGLDIDARQAAAIGGGPVFGRHSKTGTTFDVGDRRAEYRDAGAVHADEIAKVSTWIRHVAQAAGVPLDLPSPLLD